MDSLNDLQKYMQTYITNAVGPKCKTVSDDLKKITEKLLSGADALKKMSENKNNKKKANHQREAFIKICSGEDDNMTCEEATDKLVEMINGTNGDCDLLKRLELGTDPAGSEDDVYAGMVDYYMSGAAYLISVFFQGINDSSAMQAITNGQ